MCIRDRFLEVFHSVPKARAMSVDGVSYEELEFLYYGGADTREVLFDIVASINRGEVHESATKIWGDLNLLGIEKRDETTTATSPAPVPSAFPPRSAASPTACSRSIAAPTCATSSPAARLT